MPSNPSKLLLRIWPLIEFLCFSAAWVDGLYAKASMYPSVGQDTPGLRGIWRLEELCWHAACWEEACLLGYFLLHYLESSCVVFIFWTPILSLLPSQKTFPLLLMNVKVSFVVPQRAEALLSSTCGAQLTFAKAIFGLTEEMSVPHSMSWWIAVYCTYLWGWDLIWVVASCQIHFSSVTSYSFERPVT